MSNIDENTIAQLNSHFNGEKRGRTPAGGFPIQVGFKFVGTEQGCKRVKAKPVYQRITKIYLGGRVGTHTGDTYTPKIVDGNRVVALS